jgi:hypothetical protein
VLVVVERPTTALEELRNAPVHVLVPDQLNTYDVLVSDDVVFTGASRRSCRQDPRKAATRRTVARGRNGALPAHGPSVPRPRGRPAAVSNLTDPRRVSRRSSPRRATACSTRTSTRSSSGPDANKTEIKIAVEKVFASR